MIPYWQNIYPYCRPQPDIRELQKVTKKINRRSTNNILNYSSRLLESRISDRSISSELQGFHNPEKGNGEKVTVITADERGKSQSYRCENTT